LRDQNIILQDRYDRERKRAKSYMWAVYALAAIIVGAITFKIVRRM
jgi:hypothetical protein